MKVSWTHLTPAPCEMFYMETVGIFWQDDLSKKYPQTSLKLWTSQTFLWTQAALTQHNAAQRAREQLTILAGPGPESQEKEWLGTTGKTGDCWIFKGPGFLWFSLWWWPIFVEPAAKWHYMALWKIILSHQQFGGWFLLLWGRAKHLVGSLDRASLFGRGRYYGKMFFVS